MAAEGRQEDILTRKWDSGGASGTPITARRYLSFTVPRGDDDMFSSDLADAELKVSHQCCAAGPTAPLLYCRLAASDSRWSEAHIGP